MAERFTCGQFVLASIPEADITDELARVLRTDHPDIGTCQVVFLQDHKVGDSADIIMVIDDRSMRPATLEDVMTKRTAWEIANGHRLSFDVTEREGRVFIVPPRR